MAGRAQELRTCLWCPEHGYIRASHITTTTTCRLPGSTFHDGGLNRLWDLPALQFRPGIVDKMVGCRWSLVHLFL